MDEASGAAVNELVFATLLLLALLGVLYEAVINRFLSAVFSSFFLVGGYRKLGC